MKSANKLLNCFETELKNQFDTLEKISSKNHYKVAQGFFEAKVGSEHFQSTSGYGHDDIGRAKLDELFALVFKAEAALARVNFVSGTHAICCAILGNLKAQEEIVFAPNQPYDTLEPLLKYIQNHLKGKVKIAQAQNYYNFENIRQAVLEQISNKTKIVSIQRSRGYSAIRPTLNIAQIKKLIQAIKTQNPNIICFVDNCYGEFVEEQEPLEIGADLIAGSLIKNPGGGLAFTGGYIAGQKALVEKAAEHLTAPGIGTKGGPNFGQNRLLFQGLYMAPLIVCQALKGMILSARVFEYLNLPTNPHWSEARSDIIQRVDFKNRTKLIQFCKLLQSHSPVDSHLQPFPAQTPGYEDELIMAAGTFIEGSTIELSADGPLREPYSAYLQGGLSYFYTKLFLQKLIESFG